jgi:hypothetical protein
VEQALRHNTTLTTVHFSTRNPEAASASIQGMRQAIERNIKLRENWYVFETARFPNA